MQRKLSIASWALFIIVTPLTFLGIIAQNTIPGDFLYSIKRTYEDGALLALSVFPSAKADYNTNLASTRYTEAEKLIVKKSDTQGLATLVTQVRQAKSDIANVSNPQQKEELQQKLVISITQYQQGLNQVAQQVATQNSIAYVPSNIGTQIPGQNPPQYNPQQNYPAQGSQPTQQQTPPSGGQQLPTSTPTPPSPTTPTNPNPSSPTDIIKTIKDTQDTLSTLKQQVQQAQIMQIVPTVVPSPTLAPSPTHAPSPTFHYQIPTQEVNPTEQPSNEKDKKKPNSKSNSSSD